MTTKNLLFASFLAAFALISFLPGRLSGIPIPIVPPEYESSLELVLNYGESNEERMLSHLGVVEPVSVVNDQLLPIMLQCSEDKAGQPVVVGLLDGGEIIVPQQSLSVAQPGQPVDGGEIIVPQNLSVAQNGTVRFSFKPDRTPGLYRAIVNLGPEQYELSFYVRLTSLPAPTPGGTPNENPTY